MKLILQAIKSLLRSLQNSIRATQKAVADVENKADEAKDIANYAKEVADDARAAVNEKADKSDLPTALPNPNALTFTGAVEGTYDGSAPMEIEIPEGGAGGEVVYSPFLPPGGELIAELEVAEAVRTIVIDTDKNGNPLRLKNAYVIAEMFNETSDNLTVNFGFNGMQFKNMTSRLRQHKRSTILVSNIVNGERIHFYWFGKDGSPNFFDGAVKDQYSMNATAPLWGLSKNFDENISTINFMMGDTDKVFVQGCRFKVYGVRA